MSVWKTGPLRDHHDLTRFESGVTALDHWLRLEARRADRSDTARTFVWTRGDTTVDAYYSITPTQVRRDTVTRSLSGGVGVVPGYLLARLALDRRLQGRGLGSQLLLDAVQTIVAAADSAAGRLIVVDAIDERAATFYRHHDFRQVNGDESRLVMKVATARRALAGA